MSTKQLTLPQFIERLQIIREIPIWRVIHPADGWLHLDLGKQYQSAITGLKGESTPYTTGEFQLFFHGDWVIVSPDGTKISRQVQPSETQSDYFERMHQLVNSFPFHSFEEISLMGDSIVFLTGGQKLIVTIGSHSDSVVLKKVELDQKNQPLRATHFHLDEN